MLNENLIMNIKLKAASNVTKMMLAFGTYHIVKFGLWHYGYFAHFFQRTRFLTFPLLGFGIYTTVKHTMRDMKEVNLLDYNIKRIKFDKDSRLVERILKSKLDLAKERQAAA